MKVKRAQRRSEAIRLRLAGMSFEAIGKQLGITRPGAHKMVRLELEKQAEENKLNVEQLRALEIGRVNLIQQIAWKQIVDAQNANQEPPADAQNRILKCVEIRSRLQGLEQGVTIIEKDLVVIGVSPWSLLYADNAAHPAEIEATVSGGTDGLLEGPDK